MIKMMMRRRRPNRLGLFLLISMLGLFFALPTNGSEHRVIVSTDMGGVIKIGDSPSDTWLLRGTAEDPAKSGWGVQTVNRWREDFLVDFTHRMMLCEVSATSRPDGTTDSQVIRIMPLGDSITYDNRRKDIRPTGVRIAYRYTLFKLLKSAGFNVDFVGNQNSGGRYLGTTMDDNAGFPGITDEQLAVLVGTGYSELTGTQLTPGPYLETYPADIILLHIGTNKVDVSPRDVEDILDLIRQSDPDVHIIVARIINRYPYDEITTAFNHNVAAMIEARADKRIMMVDMEDGAGIDYYTDMDDDLHPNHLGYDKMAAVWFDAIVDVVSSPDFAGTPNK